MKPQGRNDLPVTEPLVSDSYFNEGGYTSVIVNEDGLDSLTITVSTQEKRLFSVTWIGLVKNILFQTTHIILNGSHTTAHSGKRTGGRCMGRVWTAGFAVQHKEKHSIPRPDDEVSFKEHGIFFKQLKKTFPQRP